jgi:hypothetical protein
MALVLETNNILCANQYMGVWKVGFVAQWLAREYLARRGHARFKTDQINPLVVRCSAMGAWHYKSSALS